MYTIQVCPILEKRTKRSADSTKGSLTQPKDFELAYISKSFPNSAPKIITDVVNFTEDISNEFTIETIDNESDILILEITNQPGHARCRITSNWTVNCTFDENYYGADYITLRVTENGLPKYEESLTNERRVLLNVSGTPDTTDRFFIDRDGHLHRSNLPSMKHVVMENANGTSQIYAGTIILADEDGDEVFNPEVTFNELGNATFDIKPVDTSEIPLIKSVAMSPKYRTMAAYNIYLNFSPRLHGNMTLKFIARTDNGSLTPSVTFKVYILENPCVYGTCNHTTEGKLACDDIRRSESFDSYICECRPGYEGQWCQTETNECQSEPCALLFDCEDLINDYKCNINVPKLMAILISSLIATGGAGFVIYKLVRRYKQKKLTDSRYLHDFYLTDVQCSVRKLMSKTTCVHIHQP